MPPRAGTLVGRRFGRLLIIGLVSKRHYAQPCGSTRIVRRYLAKCDCGTEKELDDVYIRSSRVKSCGCLQREITSRRNTIHGDSDSPEFTCWRGMIERCDSKSHKSYKDYGGRGITLCDRWRHGENEKNGYECFLEDMGRKPSPRHSIDRKDNNGPYAAENCRWATPLEQAKNKRPHPRNTWTVDRLRLLLAYHRAGFSTVKIAEKLGNITSAAVWRKIKHVHVPKCGAAP